MSFLTLHRAPYILCKRLQAPSPSPLVVLHDLGRGRLQSTLNSSWTRSSRAWPRAVSSSSTKGARLPPKKKWPRRLLSTLDPNRLLTEDLIDVSGRYQFEVHFTSQETEARMSGARTTAEYKRSRENVIPFPAGTQGYLYCRRSPHAHPAAVEIRFRLVGPDSAHLSASERFFQGSDLLREDNITHWRIHIVNVSRCYPKIWRKLVEDQLIPPGKEAELESLLSNIPRRRRAPILESIVDPFVLNLGNHQPRLCILHSENIFTGKLAVRFAPPERYASPRGLLTGTTSGKALVRFEMANISPKSPKMGTSDTTPKVVLRVLKIIEPPKPEVAEVVGQIFEEGQLVQKYDFRTGATVGPWSTTRKAEDRFITPSSRKLLEETYLRGTKLG